MCQKGTSSRLQRSEILEEEYAVLHGPLPQEYLDATHEREKEKVTRLQELFRRKGTAARCLSGGGIRSATFGFGVVQGLARHGLLEQFHYLSTLSGGGYIGSWLSGWMHRKGLQAIVRELKKTPAESLNPGIGANRTSAEF